MNIFLGCPQTSYKFPNAEQITNYLRVKNAIPTLNEFTLCFRVSIHSGLDSWVSYAANSQQTNALLINTIVNEGFDIMILHQNRRVSLNLPNNKEFHVCFASFLSASGAERHTYVFYDGELKDIVRHSNPSPLAGDGVLIIGQDQDSIGGHFSSGQSAQGMISNFMMWDRVLIDSVIEKMSKDRCLCPTGSIVSLETDNIYIFGGAAAAITNQCDKNDGI